ncbi:bifunctional glutamate N-acetyltransferase/amino-acid acetyltransferase ArgJ [Sulfurimonas sp. HSL3-7]|uniref:bifunctional glutamate N-acetyltransferase/amino-acid acetyltransferase ArgJ n=1 Tax=Sulfonitrofixus jiaomeiensis TaxID=3131938 RepID=UPI0031FA05C2
MYKITSNSEGVCAPLGFYADGIAAGLKKEGAKDMAFVYSDEVCALASVMTTNKMAAAPIHHAKGVKQTNFVMINSKNANAMTGKAGLADIEEILESVKKTKSGLVNPLMSSTGVIGVRLPKEKIIAGAEKFDLSVKNPHAAAEAIMTTDRFSKEIAVDVELEDGKIFTIGAMAKGAGMINPAMATMLCYITTDAQISYIKMQEILERVNAKTFNAASVDGDTSTNDTVFLMANSRAVCYDEEAFEEALFMVMDFLAKELVRDGEGATKLVTYHVTGAYSNTEAEKVAKALSNSLLIKTALFGEDPNWGRIAMSVGASGALCEEEKLTIAYEDVLLFKQGENLFNDEVEAKAAEIMRRDAFTINVDLGIGGGSFRAYGCDLGNEYVKINADYRT